MTPRDKTTSGQHGPKSNRGKFHQESKRPRPSSRLRREDETPPKGEKKAADPKADKRFAREERKSCKQTFLYLFPRNDTFPVFIDTVCRQVHSFQ